MLYLPEHIVIKIYIVKKIMDKVIKDEIAYFGKIKDAINSKKAVIKEIVKEGRDSYAKFGVKVKAFSRKQSHASGLGRELTWATQVNEE